MLSPINLMVLAGLVARLHYHDERRNRNSTLSEKFLVLIFFIEVVVQFKNTPKAFANFSPGFELARTLGTRNKNGMNPESIGRRPPTSSLKGTRRDFRRC